MGDSDPYSYNKAATTNKHRKRLPLNTVFEGKKTSLVIQHEMKIDLSL